MFKWTQRPRLNAVLPGPKSETDTKLVPHFFCTSETVKRTLKPMLMHACGNDMFKKDLLYSE